jgi:hypothetical protein
MLATLRRLISGAESIAVFADPYFKLGCELFVPEIGCTGIVAGLDQFGATHFGTSEVRRS